MNKPLRDPGPDIVEKILRDLEDCSWSPSQVARKARFLRAHIEALRCPEFAVAVDHIAECPLTSETDGVAVDGLGDALVLAARAWRVAYPAAARDRRRV